MKPQETRVEHAVANMGKITEGRCSVRLFKLARPEGSVLYAMQRMSEAQKMPEGPEKDKKKALILNDYKVNLRRILNLDNRDCETLTTYALTKGQELMLIPVFERMGDGVANMRFDLPAVDLTKKDAMAGTLKQYNAEGKSSNNTLLQLLAFHGKLDILPRLGVSQTAIEKMKKVEPTRRTNEKSLPQRSRIIGKDNSY